MAGFDLSGLKPLDSGGDSSPPLAPAAPAGPPPKLDVSGLKPYDPQDDFAGYASVAGRGLARGAIDTTAQTLKGLSLVPGAGVAPPNEMGLSVTPSDYDAFEAAKEEAAKPVPERNLYRAGQAVEDFGQKRVPMTRAEQESLTGQVAQGIGGVGAQVLGAAAAGPMALPAGAALFAASSAGSSFDTALKNRAEQVRNTAAFGGMSPEEQQQAYEKALTGPANLDAASRAAGFNAIVGGALGVLPLGVILRPVARTAPGLMGWATAKLTQAAQSGLTFASVGEAQHYLGQEIAKEYDPTAHYDFDPKRVVASLITGGVLGGVHPLSAPPRSSSEEIDDFLRQAQTAPGAPRPFSQTRADIDEFLRQQAQREAAGLPRLPPPDQGTPQAEAQPAPDVPPRPPAPLDQGYPSLEQEGGPREEPGPQVVATQGGQHLDVTGLRPVEEGQPNAGQPAGTVPQAPPNPPPNPPGEDLRGRDVLKALLEDERPLDEIKAEYEAHQRINPQAVMNLPDSSVSPAFLKALAAQFDENQQRIPDVFLSVTPQMQRAHKAAGISDPKTGIVDWTGYQALKAEAERRAKIPPAPGSAAAPIDLTTPASVFAGAEHTAAPTPAQAEAGNYRKRHVRWNGLDIAIETEAGGVRSGVGPDGKPWSVTLTSPYGYIKGVTGRDGDQLDVYLGPEPNSEKVYVVDQIDHGSLGFDEHKAMLGYPSRQAAIDAFHQAFSDGLGPARLGAIREMTVPEFKTWIAKGNLKRPLEYGEPVEKARALAKEHGINATEAELQEAARAHLVSGADLIDALIDSVERGALAEDRRAPEESHAPSQPAAENSTGAAPAPAGEQGTGPLGTEEGGAPPQGVEPGAPERAGSEQEPVAEPEIAAATLTTANLASIAKKIPKWSADDPARDAMRKRLNDMLATMDRDGAAIAEHCLQTASGFSVR